MSLRRTLQLVCVVSLLSAAGFGLDRTAFTLTHYELEARVDPDGHAIAIKGKIVLRNDSKQPQPNAVLQISSSLDWRLIEAGGKTLQYVSEPYTTDLDHTGTVSEAIITLPAVVAPKGTVELEVGYSGIIEQEATRLTKLGSPAEVANSSDWDRIGNGFSAVRGVGYVTWYPIATTDASLNDESWSESLASWRDREAQADMDLRLCWVTDDDEPPSILTNGAFVRIGGRDDDEVTKTGCSDYKFASIGRVAPTFAMVNYERLQRPALTVYHTPVHKAGAQETVVAAEKVLPFVEDWFGTPAKKSVVIELPETNDAPYEIGEMMFMPMRAGDPKFAEISMVHQFTMSAVRSQRPWIDQGLASFAQALWRERQDRRKGALAYMATRMTALAATEHQLGTTKGSASDEALTSTTNEILLGTKSMYVWWMLRDMMGESILQAALKAYRQDQDKEPSYLQKLLEQRSKRNLESFFDDWVYRDRGLPNLRIESINPRETLDGHYVIAVTLENTGNAGAEVPITVSATQGEQTVRLLVPAKQKAITRISVPFKPDSVIVNDGSIPEIEKNTRTVKLEIEKEESPESPSAQRSRRK